jgi:hypothetical protein
LSLDSESHGNSTRCRPEDRIGETVTVGVHSKRSNIVGASLADRLKGKQCQITFSQRHCQESSFPVRTYRCVHSCKPIPRTPRLTRTTLAQPIPITLNISTCSLQSSTHPELKGIKMCSAPVPDGEDGRNEDVVPRVVHERDAPMENVFIERRMRRILGLMPVSNADRSARRG